MVPLCALPYKKNTKKRLETNTLAYFQPTVSDNQKFLTHQKMPSLLWNFFVAEEEAK